MRLSEVKSFLSNREQFTIQLPDGTAVESHFHVTEIGETTKSFVDCGGTLRRERHVTFQLWSASDYDHRLHPEKLVKIIAMAEDALGLGDLDVQVEYQGRQTIEVYGLAVDGDILQLRPKTTDCLALEACDLPAATSKGKKQVSLNQLIATNSGACTPGGGCC